MHIKALLVLLPLLLDPASSLAIPPAGDPRAAPGLDSSVHQSGVIPDYFESPPIPRGQRNRIEKHVKPIKSEKIKEDFDIGSQYHTLNTRSPAKDKKNKNNGPKKDPKNTPKPAEEKSTTQETKPQGESSGTQPEGATTRSRQKEEDRKKEEERQKAEASKTAEESKKAEGQPPTEETKPQGEPSGTQPQSQPGSSEKKEEEKQSNPGGQTLNLPDRTKEDDKSSETKTDTPGTQGEPAKTPDQQGDQNDGADDKSGKTDDKGKGKAPDKDGKKDYKDNMYHLVDPDPNKSRAKEALNGDRYFDRKIGDGNPNGPSRYNTHNPDFSGVQSPGQEPGVSKAESERTGEPQRPRPGEREEKATTGHKTKNEKGETLSEWHRITPKPQDQLEKDQKPWTEEDLRQNLIKQQKEFPNHKSEDKTDEYGKLTQEMLKMCNTEQCKVQNAQRKLRRSITDQPLLRRRLESLLQERDHLVAMAMR